MDYSTCATSRTTMANADRTPWLSLQQESEAAGGVFTAPSHVILELWEKVRNLCRQNNRAIVARTSNEEHRARLNMICQVQWAYERVTGIRTGFFHADDTSDAVQSPDKPRTPELFARWCQT